MNRNLLRWSWAASLFVLPLLAMGQRVQQRLGRGVVVAKNGGTALVTWRRLAQEPESARWNVYVNGSKLNSQPVSNTNWQTSSSNFPAGAQVTVAMVGADGSEGAESAPFKVQSFDMRNMFMSITFESAGSPLQSANYGVDYVWPIDLDGDGEMDYVVNRKGGSAGLDCYVEGYLASGRHLWTVRLGPNELSCSGQDDMITVADMDCDGLGDVVIQSSDGTQFWDSAQGTFGLYVNAGSTGDTDGDGIIDYETQSTRNAPRYISVIDGMTGAEKGSIEQSYNSDYNRTNRSSLMGDEYNKHVGHMGVAFLDGRHPSVVMEWHTRDTGGGHHYYNLGVSYYDLDGGYTGLHELFNERTGGPAFHQIRVGDTDGDGRDEMIVGGYTMDHTGSTLFNTGIAHGDRFRTSDIDPERPGLETFAIQQYAGDMLGQVLYDARTGEFIKRWYMAGTGDVGRGECMDVDPAHLGWEMWSTMDGNVYDAQGNPTGLGSQYPCEGIWWDDQPDREIVQTSDSHYNVYIQDFFNGREVQFASISNWRYLTVYAKRAAFWGDIIGDWREELVLLHKENGVTVGIVGVTTDYPTNIDNIYCLQEDPHYRGDCSTKGYYQSPNPGFYLGYDMPRPPLPPCMVADVIASPGMEMPSGSSVLLDLSFGSADMNVSGTASPTVVYAMPVRDQAIGLKGSGQMAGSMDLWKSQQGTLRVDVPLNYEGTTYISEGVLELNNTVKGTVELRARGTLAGNATVEGPLVLESALNYEGGRLMPGTAETQGVITLKKGLTVDGRLFAEMNVWNADKSSDLIAVEGDLVLGEAGQLVLNIKPDTERLTWGSFKLISFTGEVKGSLAQVSVIGLQGLDFNIEEKDNALWLTINEQREAADGVRWTGSSNTSWDYKTPNFSLNESATAFVANDAVTVGDDAENTTIVVNDMMPVGSMTFENDSKVIIVQGDGGFSGSGDLVKNGKGRVNMNVTRSNYTGRTIINSGVLSVKELADGGLPSSIGAASSAAQNLQIGKATLVVNNSNSATNRGVTLTDTAIINVANGICALKGIVTGNGVLHKTGSGQLNLTYDGVNPYKGTILQAGTLAMGTWRSTFGSATSPIEVTGNSTITVFNVNSTSTVPTLQNTITIQKGRTLTINGGQRCKIQGSWKGEGTVKINFPYVRGDVETNMSDFEGTFNPTSGQLRLSSTLDLSKGTLQVGPDVYVAHVRPQAGNEEQRTAKIGALSGSDASATLSTGTWEVGHKGTNTTFAGKLNGNARLVKVGDGVLTLTGSSEAAMTINAGALSMDCESAATTSALVTVNSGGTVCGTGKTAAVTVSKNGMLAAGRISSLLPASLTITGALTVAEGGKIRVRGRGTSTSIDSYDISEGIRLNSPCFVMERLSDDWQPDTDYKVFKGSGQITLSGTPTFEPAIPREGYLWDTTALATDGILRIVPDPVGIHGTETDGETPVIYDLSGRRVETTQPQHGIYLMNGKKIRK